MSPNMRYRCQNCGYVYDELVGSPTDGVPAGARWDDLPEDWLCPNCGSEKRDFEPL
jgi:rubredoxin